MSTLKLSAIHKYEQLTEIKVNELNCDYINDSDSYLIETLSETLNKKLISI